jgi:hypothetical protein
VTKEAVTGHVVTPRNALGVIGALALVGALMAAAVVLEAARERSYATSDAVEDALYLTSGAALRRMTVGFNGLAADAYWIRTIQYFGGTRRRLMTGLRVPPPPPALAASADYDQLYPMLDVTTSLDPRFKIAYRFGAVFLAEPYPSGPGRPDLAVRLLQKGLREQPDKWEYMEDIGFVHYWYGHDYRAAAESFQRAGEVPGAPWWLRSLAATTLAEGGDRASSRTMWRAIRESAEIDWLRRDAERRLSQLDALDQIDGLQRLVDRYRGQSGHPPTEWPAMVAAGAIPGIPADPARTPYLLTSDGRVRMSESSPLWPLPEEPQRRTP